MIAGSGVGARDEKQPMGFVVPFTLTVILQMWPMVYKVYETVLLMMFMARYASKIHVTAGFFFFSGNNIIIPKGDLSLKKYNTLNVFNY